VNGQQIVDDTHAWHWLCSTLANVLFGPFANHYFLDLMHTKHDNSLALHTTLELSRGLD
jgi:hypothetical protein